MRYNLTFNERAVLICLKEELALPATTIADRIELEVSNIIAAIDSLAEKELVIAEDGTGEISPSGISYNLFDDESIYELSGKVRRETEVLLRYFLEDPNATPSRQRLEVVDGLTPEEIDRAIED